MPGRSAGERPWACAAGAHPWPRARSWRAMTAEARTLPAISGLKIRRKQKQIVTPADQYSQIPRGGSLYTPTRFNGSP